MHVKLIVLKELMPHLPLSFFSNIFQNPFRIMPSLPKRVLHLVCAIYQIIEVTINIDQV